MEFIKQWTFCVCISLITASIFSLLAPRGSMQGFFKLLISVFVFISFLVPLQNAGKIDFDLSKIEITDELQLSQNSTAQTMINAEVKRFLDDNEIIGSDVSSIVRYDKSSGEIDIKDLQVAVSDEYDKSEVEALIFDSLGIKARVISVGG